MADLFHALFDLSKGLGWELNCLASRLQKQLNQARHNSAPAELIEQLEREILVLQTSQQDYQDCCHQLSTSLHPFAIADSSIQSTLEVKTLPQPTD